MCPVFWPFQCHVESLLNNKAVQKNMRLPRSLWDASGQFILKVLRLYVVTRFALETCLTGLTRGHHSRLPPEMT
jgi:hypothetical protein